MSDPTKIEGHSADALRRMTDYFQGKRKVAAMLRTKAAARVDVKEVVEGELHGFRLGDCLIQASAVLGETAATLSSKFRDLINDVDAENIPNVESLEEFPFPGVFVGEGVHGLWSEYFGPTPFTPWPLTNEQARAGSRSVKYTLEGSLPPVFGPPVFTLLGAVEDYPGMDEPSQAFEYWFRFEDLFPNVPNPGGPTAFYMRTYFGAVGSSGGQFAELEVECLSQTFKVSTSYFGGPPSITFGPFPLASINDGAWHKFTFNFETDGSFVEVLVDDTFGGSGVMAGPTGPLTGAILLSAYQNYTGVAVAGGSLKGFYIDDIKFGVPRTCSVYDLTKFVPATAESFESLPLGDPLDGVLGFTTWVDAAPFPPDVNYLGGFVSNDDFARTGSRSIKTTWSTGGVAFASGGLEVIHAATASVYEGGSVPLKRFETFVRIPSTFPNAALPPEIAGFFLPAIFVAQTDFAAFFVATIFYDAAADDFKLTVFIPGFDAGLGPNPLTIPKAVIADGVFHRLTLTASRDVDGNLVAKLDLDLSSVTRVLTPDVDAAKVLDGPAIISFFAGALDFSPYATVFGVDDVFFDDVSVGGFAPRVVEDKAVKRSEDDPFLYVYSSLEQGAELVLSTTQPERIGFHNIGVVDQVQELEDALFDVLLKRSLGSAEGVQLDKLGEIVGLRRAIGQSDELYRPLIEVQIQSNLSKGEIERLIEIVKAFTDSTTVQLQEFFPGNVQVAFDGVVTNPSDLLQVADGAAAGGVRLVLVQVPAFPFTFFGDPEGGGFGDGEFAGSVT